MIKIAVNLLLIFVVFGLLGCSKESRTNKDLPKMVQTLNRDNLCSMGEVLVEINAKTFDVNKTGLYHNLLLTYVSENDNGFVYNNDNQLHGHIDSLIHSGLSVLSLTYSDVYDYISDPVLGGSPDIWEQHLAQVGFGSAPVDSLKAQFNNSLILLYSYNVIKLEEKTILNSYVNDLCAGNNINYNSILSQIDNIPNKAFEGACSKSILSIGFHSSCWWKNFYTENVNPHPTTSEFVGNAMADLIGGAYGWGSYCVNNWSHHYESDFGINGLSAAGDRALGASAMSFSRLFF